jgi:uncharacterized membrane protein YeiB
MKQKKPNVLIGINILGIVTTVVFHLYYMVYFVETRISWSKDEFSKALKQNVVNDSLVSTSETLLSNIEWNQTICTSLLQSTQLLSAILVIIFIINIVVILRLKKSGSNNSDKNRKRLTSS